MNTHQSRTVLFLSLVCGSLLVILAAFIRSSDTDVAPSFMKTMYRLTSTFVSDDLLVANIASLHKAAPSGVLEQNAEKRRERAAMNVHVRFITAEGAIIHEWDAAAKDHPEWFANGDSDAVQTVAVASALSTFREKNVPRPLNATVSNVTNRDGVLVATTDGIAKPGYVFDESVAASAIAQALVDGAPALDVIVTKESGKLINATGLDLGDLELLGSGHSNFGGSDNGRKANVRKGLTERMQNVVVEPGATFHFNDVLGPISVNRGWHMALAIFDGWDLRPAPGGGLCQVATTVYRAALLTGLPITMRKNHSLYVHYYEKYGAGLDATIFPGKQDLVFVNDTPDYIVFQSIVDGDEATVNVYGTPDGRSVEMKGPFFKETAIEGMKLGNSAIGWTRTVTDGKGGTREEIITSPYNSIPKSARKIEVSTISSSL